MSDKNKSYQLGRLPKGHPLNDLVSTQEAEAKKLAEVEAKKQKNLQSESTGVQSTNNSTVDKEASTKKKPYQRKTK